MSVHEQHIEIGIGPRRIAGTIVSPSLGMEGMLFIHGWAGNRQQYLVRAREIAALGCICLTFDLYGHASTSDYLTKVTRDDNLCDVLAAYDLLATNPHVDKSCIGVVGSSYGGYLAALLTEVRPVRWLALRAPALYLDEDWEVPKHLLNKDRISAYRKTTIKSSENRALRACSHFKGDVLLVESEHDLIVPSLVTANYRTAFDQARSLTFRMIKEADHALTEMAWQDAYTALLSSWAKEMMVDGRKTRKTEKPEIIQTVSTNNSGS
jgi:esterase/lipase